MCRRAEATNELTRSDQLIPCCIGTMPGCAAYPGVIILLQETSAWLAVPRTALRWKERKRFDFRRPNGHAWIINKARREKMIDNISTLSYDVQLCNGTDERKNTALSPPVPPNSLRPECDRWQVGTTCPPSDSWLARKCNAYETPKTVISCIVSTKKIWYYCSGTCRRIEA